MKTRSRQTIAVVAGAALAWTAAVVVVAGQGASAPKPPLVESVFKNIQVLKGIPVDEFMGTMGIFSAALGVSCEECHAVRDRWEDYALDNTDKKATARRMVVMMSSINRGNFGGRQVVTCYTCHRGSERPKVTPSLAALYGASPPEEPEDVIAQAAGAPSADQILDKYIDALGGTARLATLTSFVGKGTGAGYGPDADERPVEVFAKAPAQRTTIIHTLDGERTTTFDGSSAWIAAPHRPVPVLALSGGELDGARLEAQLSFPGRIKEIITKWRVGLPATIDDREVQVLQGTTAAGSLVTFYFDQSGLLARLVRYADSRVGRMPTQIDYSDYRDVGGVKLPFRWTVTWLDGKDTITLTEVQRNAPIDAAKFTQPAAPAR